MPFHLRFSHHPGIAKAEAPWDDFWQLSLGATRSDSPRLIDVHGQAGAFTTAEFARDAMNAPQVVRHILIEELTE